MNLRGLITSLGAGGSLIAAALCAAIIVGGMLAVGEAVDGPAEASGGDVTVPGGTASATQTSAPDPPPAASATPVTAERGAPALREQRRAPSQPAERRSEPAPVAAPPAADAPAGSDSTFPGKDAGGGSGGAPPPAEGDEAVSVRRAVREVRETVAPVVDAVPEPAQPAVDQVADTVEDIGDTVDETLAPVTDLLP